jgi:hypothetical protein
LNFFILTRSKLFLSRLVTTNQSWLYHYDADTKQQSTECRHSGSPRPAPKNSMCKNRMEIFSSRFCGDQDSIPLLYYLPKGQTLNVENYSSLLVQLKYTCIFKDKHHSAGRSPSGVLFLNDNAPAHPTHATLNKLA